MAGPIDDRPALVLFGDSITVGEYVNPHKTWAVMLSAWMEERFPEWRVILAGRNGDTTRLALERMPFDVLRYRPKAVIVQFGHNDANRWETDGGLERVSIDGYRRNLVEIANHLDSIGAKHVNVIPHATDKTGIVDWDTFEPDWDNYDWRVGTYGSCETPPPFTEVVVEPAEHLLDGLHLNENGHRVYLGALKPIVEELCAP